MKILFHSTRKAQIDTAKALLEANGIPAFIGSENSGPAMGGILANKYTLWACLESQYDEALTLLNNPDYEVKNPVDIADYYRFVRQSSFAPLWPIYNNALFWIVLMALTGFGLFVYRTLGSH